MRSGYDILHESANIVGEPEPEQSEMGRRAWKAASRAAKHMSKHSKIVNPKMEKSIPRFEGSEIVIGKHLGSGGFNNVFELERIDLLENPLVAPHARKICSELQQQHRSFVAKHVYRESSKSRRYAVKYLSPDSLQDEERFCTGAADLVVEAKFLASLSHPHIVKLRGMAAAGTSGFASVQEQGYFLVLDRLQCTLDDRLEEWKCDEDRPKRRRNGKHNKHFLADRLHVAYDVASALQYLHEHNIIYRDLKPDNIGFDVRGDVKLFDFGLAKELNDSMRYCEEFYELSGNTGSLRYMAPEVALSEPYNLTADVYSYGLLLWQICSLELPYDGMTRQDHADFVVEGNERPRLESSVVWSTPLRILMKRCWEPCPSIRPSMVHVHAILKREITVLRDGDETGLDHNTNLLRRRSTFVLNRDSKTNNTNTTHQHHRSGRRNSSTLSRTATIRRDMVLNNNTHKSKMILETGPTRMTVPKKPSKRGAMAA